MIYSGMVEEKIIFTAKSFIRMTLYDNFVMKRPSVYENF